MIVTVNKERKNICFAPGLNLFLNNRDHRKITVIDGKVGFTGGYNLANEYFHRTEPYGFWKDTGIRLEGDAVQSLTLTFLERWNAVLDDDKDDRDFTKYMFVSSAEHVLEKTAREVSCSLTPILPWMISMSVRMSISAWRIVRRNMPGSSRPI